MKESFFTTYLLPILIGVSILIIERALNAQTSWLTVPFVIITVSIVVGYNLHKGSSVFRKYRVKNIDKELIHQTGRLSTNDAWEIDSSIAKNTGVYGPYIGLKPGSYQAIFRLKTDNNSSADEKLIEIDVTSSEATKILAFRNISAKDFRYENTYQNFPLNFHLIREDKDVEFHLRVTSAQLVPITYAITLEYVELKRILITLKI